MDTETNPSKDSKPRKLGAFQETVGMDSRNTLIKSNAGVILSEKYGIQGKEYIYKERDEDIICSLKGEVPFANNFFQEAFTKVFLPTGFPDSVSEDYVNYQLWDTLQAFCSTITGIFTTQQIFKSVGVGDQVATPLSAAFTWVLKDGAGMIGRILFAWLKGESLDPDCKQWRLFADVLNDCALTLEFLLPSFYSISVYVLCLTSIMKALVGVTGAATRASITHHQAKRGNMADVSAKDGSQETCVNLFASFVGILFLKLFESPSTQWILFMFFTLLHIFANYMAVNSLVFSHLNKTRLMMVMRTYLKYDTVPNPLVVNKKEPLFVGTGLTEKSICGFDVKVGASLKHVVHSLTPGDLRDFMDSFDGRGYFIVPNFKERSLYVALQPDQDSEDIITAYFHAVMLGISLSIYNHIDLDFKTKRQLRHQTPLQRLETLMRSFPRNSETNLYTFPLKNLKMLNEFMKGEVMSFFTALQINEWMINVNSLLVDEWRCHFKSIPRTKANLKKTE